MSDDEPVCKVCGHSHLTHRFADPIICTACPDRVCQVTTTDTKEMTSA